MKFRSFCDISIDSLYRLFFTDKLLYKIKSHVYYKYTWLSLLNEFVTHLYYHLLYDEIYELHTLFV